jgi:hypothetical protein
VTLHSALDYSENHVAHAYEYANSTQRETASGFVSGDIGKLALQTDDNTLWMLQATTPTWVAAILTGAITVDTISEDTPNAGVTIDGVLCKDNAVTASGGVTANLIGNVTGNVTGNSTGDITGDLYAANAEKVVDNGATADAADFLDSSGYSRLIPSGGIILWSGAISAIPNGWYLCDGTNSTPNLTDRFVIHADADSGGTNDVGDSGNATAATDGHSLITAELASHNHTVSVEAAGSPGSGGPYDGFSYSSGNEFSGGFKTTASTCANTGSGSAHTHNITSLTPKYYALAYIMKA